MTPAARVAAAIDCLDEIAGGAAAEKVLTTWARKHRFAGSKDRAAIRDHVFDALRCWRSTAWEGGGESGRARMLGLIRQQEGDPDAVFTGIGHAPAPLTPGEASGGCPLNAAPLAVRLDWPDWLMPETGESIGSETEAVLETSRLRAPVFLRVSMARITRAQVIDRLAASGIAATRHAEVDSALCLADSPRGLQQLDLFTDGLVELQDAHSQAVVTTLPLRDGMRVLDFCAGGGGKTLAMAARARLDLAAHDQDPRRMRDLPARAARAGVEVAQIASDRLEKAGPFDLVLADVPCSGSGSWRRAPEGKWRLTPERYRALRAQQAQVLAQAAALTAPGGYLAYVTCSVLRSENEIQSAGFLSRHSGWRQTAEHRFLPGAGGDGFYQSVFERN